MNKQAISVSLEPGNLLWLRAARARGQHRSVSEVLDALIAEARGAGRKLAIRSVRGTIAIAGSDPELRTADAALRTLLAHSLGRRASRRRRARGSKKA
jgi:hypothetical protein